MSDQHPAKTRRAAARPPQSRGPDYAAQMARAEFGRFYLDPERVAQTLRDGEVVFRDRSPGKRDKP